MKKVLIVGPLLSISGYGYHSRQLFNFFKNNKNYEVSSIILPWGNTSWFLNKELENGLIDEIVKSSIDKNTILRKSFDVGIHIQLPDEWNTSYAKKNIGVSAFVETDICSKDWLNCIDKVDKVIVPSNFTKNVILNSENNQSRKKEFNKKVHVIPEYYHEIFDKEIKQELKIQQTLDNIQTKTNFLTVGQLTSHNEELDRKNLIKTIEIFCNKYRNDKDVGLIVKTSLGRSNTLDKKNTKMIFNNIIKKIKKGSEYPRVYLLHGDLSPQDLKVLYSHEKVKYYISLTKGEGYGLPLLEAARCGLPIIATNWSGHLDFLRDEFIKIDYQLKEIPEGRIDQKIFVEGSKWALFKPSSVLKAFKNLNNQKFKVNKKFYQENYSKKAIEKQYLDFFKRFI